MKIEKLTVRKNGKVFTGDVVWPTGIHQAIHLLGELEVWEAFKIGYLQLAKKRISGAIRPRKKWLKVDLSSLDENARAWLCSHVENQKAEEAARSQKAAAQQTSRNDYDETQEEASGADQLSENDGQPAQEPPKYSDALDSSTQQQTETAFEPLDLEEDLHRGTRLA